MEEFDVYDHATVTIREASTFFRMGYQRFAERFDKEFHTKIRSVKLISRGRRLLLTDVVKVAFPEADKFTVHVIAYDWLMSTHRRNAQRVRAYLKRGEKK
jgi:hypothetical protein